MQAPPSDANDPRLTFVPEDASDDSSSAPSRLIVMSVDDDPAFQQSLRLALASFRFQDMPVEFRSVGSAAAAAKALTETPDMALILLDVVMESDDAGLRLVRSIREVLGNAEVRIVLLTGQPGVAPRQQTLERLDISDYWLKTELKREHLHGILTGNLRTWQEIRAMGRAKRGLQVIVEASNSLARTRNLRHFSERMIYELSRLLGVPPDGLVCVQTDDTDASPLAARLIGVAGRFSSVGTRTLGTLEDAAVRDLLARALSERHSLEGEDCQVLFFSGTSTVPDAAAYLATGRTLDETERELLHVFATNIGSGLINVALATRLDRVAYEDELLGIPNGSALARALEAVLDIVNDRDRSLLVVDLNQYSQSTMTLGAEHGDMLLRWMAQRLREVFPPPCMVARLHEDTFAILGPSEMVSARQVEHLETSEDPAHVPFIGTRTALLDLDGFSGTAREAVGAGLLLLKRARARGPGGHAEYRASVEDQAGQRFLQSHALYRGLRSGSVTIALQPQVDMLTGKVVGAEALARWTDENGVSVPPDQFIPIAEATGLILPLGLHVIDLACDALEALADAGYPDITVSVNVSPLQLLRRDFGADLFGVLHRRRIAPDRLEIEITEAVVMEDYESHGSTLRRLREAGIRIAVDDFGTGYSSLRYLHALPVTSLKLDRSFIGEIGKVADERNVADMVIALGQRLGLQVIAEGVETQAQVAWLTAHGCQFAQGYYYGRPIRLDEFVRHLSAQHGTL